MVPAACPVKLLLQESLNLLPLTQAEQEQGPSPLNHTEKEAGDRGHVIVWLWDWASL